MAFTRKFLTAMGIESEKVDEIMAAHVEVTDALKAQINDSKDEADKLVKVQAELDKLKASQKDMAEKLSAAEKERDEIKGKYDTVTADLDKIKAENEERETDEKCRKALADFLHEQKFSDFAVKNITGNGVYKSVQFGEDGKATNLDEILKTIQTDERYSGFMPKISEKSHIPATPPANTGGVTKATWEDVDKIKDAEERQAFMAQHKDDLGI